MQNIFILIFNICICAYVCVCVCVCSKSLESKVDFTITTHLKCLIGISDSTDLYTKAFVFNCRQNLI